MAVALVAVAAETMDTAQVDDMLDVDMDMVQAEDTRLNNRQQPIRAELSQRPHQTIRLPKSLSMMRMRRVLVDRELRPAEATVVDALAWCQIRIST